MHPGLAAVVLVMVAVNGGVQSFDDDPRELFWLAARALAGTLDYFQRHYREVNLDAIIGTRIVEGQFSRLLEKLDVVDVEVPDEYTHEVRRLMRKAGRFSEMATPFVALRNKTYYARMGITTNRGFWTLWREGRDADPSLVTPSMYMGEAINEGTSDRCISEMFGTSDKSKRECSITDQCWRLMTAPGYELYSLSHQIFYLECGLQFGCKKAIEAKIRQFRQASLDQQITTYCSNMLSEAQSIADDGFMYDDLFMEQATLCGMLGFRQFFTVQWLRDIIRWQDPKLGCYTLKPASDQPLSSEPPGRSKREEKVLDNNCMCHRTTVAAGALSQYIRYILDYIIIASHLDISRPVLI